ncbi:MAG: imelysin family protein [Bacteroidota bacterium]
MQIRQNKIVFVLLSLWLGFSACKEGPEETKPCEFDLGAMQQHLGTELIVPAWNEMATKAKALDDAAKAFAETTGQNTLQALQNAHKEAHLAVQAVTSLNFGPAIDMGFDYRERINTFPTSEAGVDQAVADKLFDVENSFKSVVGLPAIAYLIYGPIGSSDAEVLTSLEDMDRVEYLLLLTAQVEKRSKEVADAWSPSGGDYLAGFASSSGSGEGSAIALLANELNFDFETVKNFKFKLPLGRLNGGVIQLKKAEGYHAGNSLELAEANLRALYNLYRGGTSAANDLSLEGYLRCLKTGEELDEGLLADEIEAQWQTIFSSLEPLNDPLTTRLEDDKSTVDDVYLNTQQMVPLLKREMTAAIGVRIVYNDNDGD